MRVSIALCTYNGAQFLQELLDSIENQTVLPDEMIISDDASSDETYALLENFKKTQTYPISIFKTENTRGVNLNHDFALRRCSGDIIFIADGCGNNIEFPLFYFVLVIIRRRVQRHF